MNRLTKTIKLNNMIIVLVLVLAGSLLVTGCNSNKEDLSSDEDIIRVDEIAPRCSECNNQMQGQKDNKKFVCINPSCDKFEDTIEFSEKDLSILLEEESKKEVRKVQCDECGVMFVPEEGKTENRCNKCKTAYDKSIKEQETDYLYNKKCSSCGTQFTTEINTDTKCYDCNKKSNTTTVTCIWCNKGKVINSSYPSEGISTYHDECIEAMKEQNHINKFPYVCDNCGERTDEIKESVCIDCYNKVEEEQQNDSTSSMLEPESN